MESVVTNRVHRGNVVHNAIVFNFRNSLGDAVITDNLLQTVSRLFALFDEHQIDYLLVGGIALLQYIEGCNTQDIDLIMAASSLEKRLYMPALEPLFTELSKRLSATGLKAVREIEGEIEQQIARFQRKVG